MRMSSEAVGAFSWSKLFRMKNSKLAVPLLPESKPKPSRFLERKPVANRGFLAAILFVLRTGIHWENLP